MTDRHPKYAVFVERNLDLAHQLLQAQFADPDRLAEIPDSATIVFLPADDSELTAYNLEIGLAAVRNGRDVYFRHVGARMAP